MSNVRRGSVSGRSPSHGENRGSSPLGSANRIKYLIGAGRRAFFVSPIFLQMRSLISAVIKSQSTNYESGGQEFRISSGAPFSCDSRVIRTAFTRYPQSRTAHDLSKVRVLVCAHQSASRCKLSLQQARMKSTINSAACLFDNPCRCSERQVKKSTACPIAAAESFCCDPQSGQAPVRTLQTYLR